MRDVNHLEITVLGAMMQEPVTRQDAAAVLRSEDFALDSHQRIYRAILKLGESADIRTVADDLRSNGELEAVGGSAYLAELTEGVPRGMDIHHYIKRIQDEALGRRSVFACQRALQKFVDGTDPCVEIVDGLVKTLTVERPEDTMTAADVVPKALQQLFEGEHAVISTGVHELDEMTMGGLRTKELWIIGAQPSFGKSALCRQIERSVIRQGYGVHAHSIEVSRDKWMLQHTANIAGLPSWKLRKPSRMSAIDKDKMLGAATEVEQWPYRIDDAGGVQFETLLAKSRLSVMRHETKVFTIDYLQMLIQNDDNAHRELSRIARKLKQFAKDYDVCVIALSQMSRKGDINIRPKVQHLKESGDLEAAADVVVLNYRPKNEKDHFTGEDELIVGKQRDGAVGAIDMRFDEDSLEFHSREAA